MIMAFLMVVVCVLGVFFDKPHYATWFVGLIVASALFDYRCDRKRW